MNDIKKDIEEYSPNKKRKILTVFDDMIADILSNRKVNTIVTELFVRGRKLNFFMMQCYFAVTKSMTLNYTGYLL